MTCLLLAAFPPELAGLAERPPEGWRTACTGVGAVAAAAATARLLAEEPPERVLFLGTCGAYEERLFPGDLVAAREVRAVSLEELEGRAYRPGIERVRWEADWLPPFPGVVVAVPPAITREAAGAARLAALAAVEHLELSGVFEACRAASVPVGAALAVANRVGPQAHAEWLAHHEEASRGLVRALLEARVFG